MSTNPISIDRSAKFQRADTEETRSTDTRLPVKSWTRREFVEATGPELTFDDLFPVKELVDPSLLVAQRLLAELVETVERAIRLEVSAEVIQADDQVHKVRVIFGELFCLRKISDGFGALVNALEISLANQSQQPLNLKQLQAISRSLKSLKAYPFLNYELALKQIRELRSAGLNTTPTALEKFELVANE